MTVEVNPSSPVEEIADTIEWICVKDSNGYLSWAEVVSDLRLLYSGNEATAIYGKSGFQQSNTETFELILEEWVEVLSYRFQACGSGDGYPFNITKQGLEFRGKDCPAYLFQLLVSLGKNDRHPDGTAVPKLFEELSAAAAGRYLGDSKTCLVFGFPRSDLPKGFRDAVNRLVEFLNEGKACRSRRGLDEVKDDGLDVVAWREFPDRKASKLILFGQCATGQHWQKKAHELLPDNWCKRNLVDSPAVNPVPAFFVPRALSEKDAGLAGINQVLLDRCRISALCSGKLSGQLKKRLWAWIDSSCSTQS
ncbi:MAG: hypothetical protein F4065_09545 [Rhodothermaceae bacterium]|nr:hypothetical protein [Rhodothermaceae bacterium]MXZ57240.1 hypothetical protein [Rhodothermaceae bacterium]MYB90936.1 hypothetical protein [Rhodothermaceae bacterium]MYD67811.1 hypothetical protein [Rhodothermaceae bacterium]MYG45106.1 hypothetical protein [Rhodothermaceae bacterium]